MVLAIRRAAAGLALCLAVMSSAGSAAGQTRPAAKPEPHRLLVISVDGLDWRYLRDRDALGLAIPTLRKMLLEGEVADGVAGVVPTITWPSHTTIITGVRPEQHGVLSNARAGAPVNESYWSVNVLKARTLYNCAAEDGRTTATITWPTTVYAPVTWNLPEYYLRRNGGSMDLEGVASQATPGLIAEITREYPSFPQQWVDDRVRTLATVYLLQKKKPDLLLVHLIDLDSDSHDRGPFEGESKATLERTDDLIRQMQAAAKPAGYRIVITSDHGFERIDRVVNIRARAAREGITGDLQIVGSLVVTKDAAVAAWLARLAGDKGSGVGRAVAREELLRFAPAMTEAVAAYEPQAHMTFGGAADGPLEAPPREKGEHGLWPGRPDYRSTYLLWGPGIAPAKLPQISMLDIKDRLAAAMALACPTRLQ